MTTRTLFHGTTYENYISILQHGFDSYKAKTMTWNCSNESEVYFWDMNKDGNYVLDWGTHEDLKNELIRNAFESASVTAGISGTMDNRLVVFELKIDSGLCRDDDSAENMSDIATIVESDDLKLGMIEAIYISENYNPHLRFFYIPTFNDLINIYDFSDAEQKALDIIKNSNAYLDVEDYLDFQWEKKTLSVYDILVNRGIDIKDIDNHCSDLYVKVSEVSTDFVKYELMYPQNVETFKSNIDNSLWYDIPFMYTEYYNN